MKKSELLNKINPLILNGIAHRGLHDEHKTENSLSAFLNAINHNFAFELDVHISKDLKLIVCHDDDLLRTTGKSGIIEDLTYDEIRNNYKLLDGEDVPTLFEVLELNNERVPIVIELKVRNKNGKLLAKVLKEELSKHVKDFRNYMLISFDPRALWGLGKIPYATSLLVTPSHGWTYIFRNCFDSLDVDQKMIDLKKVQRYSKNHFLNVWTIESEEQFNKVKEYVDTITFQHMDINFIRNNLN